MEGREQWTGAVNRKSVVHKQQSRHCCWHQLKVQNAKTRAQKADTGGARDEGRSGRFEGSPCVCEEQVISSVAFRRHPEMTAHGAQVSVVPGIA